MPTVGPAEVAMVIAYIAVFVLLIYALIVGVTRILGRLGSSAPGKDAALDALRVRLASGEIDEPEYRRLRSVLQGR